MAKKKPGWISSNKEKPTGRTIDRSRSSTGRTPPKKGSTRRKKSK